MYQLMKQFSDVPIILFQEVDEILELLKCTWRVLGITETVHYTCYTWVLFRQVHGTQKSTSRDRALQFAVSKI